MQTNSIPPRKALNKAYLKVKPIRSNIELFKTHLIHLIESIDNSKDEEFHKTEVRDFLRNTFYKDKYYFNVKKNIDWAIFNGPKASDTIGVLIETKKPTNKGEMLSKENINKKALQELLLYFLRERITHQNLKINHLIATNINEWFIFDARVFENLFAEDKSLVADFTDFEETRLSGTGTDFFYKKIAEPAIEKVLHKLEYTHFDIRDFERALKNKDKEDDRKLIVLYKLLSPEHLLKLPFANDSNSLDKTFYSELLHIIGLSESKEGNKKIIQRKPEGKRDAGSLIENAIVQVESLDKLSRLTNPSHYGATHQERLFNISLELAITWVNRILFLKLLEAQLIAYHHGDKSYAFLNSEKVKNYDDLNTLFFSVLARKPEQRLDHVKNLFAQVPYLNSSLFEISDIEDRFIVISNLRDELNLPIMTSTVLKDNTGKRRTGQMNSLEYFFAFLDAYDFSSEGAEDIQEENKSLINASVLGLIFEKINGYKDGSFFTPGFITMYMCRETIRRAVVEKFNEARKSPQARDKVLTPGPSPKTERGVIITPGTEVERGKVLTPGSSSETEGGKVLTPGPSPKTERGVVITPGTEVERGKVLTPGSQMEGEKVLTPDPSPKTERGVVPVHHKTVEDNSDSLGINEKTSEDETSSTPLHDSGEGSVRSTGGEDIEDYAPLNVTASVPPELLQYARELRKSQTRAEDFLWQLLRNRKLNNWKFRRQHPIQKGFILDFFCAETKIGIELDGGYHEETSQKEYDEARTRILEKYGIKILRFKNEEVLEDPKRVLERIVGFSVLTPGSSSEMERGKILTPGSSSETEGGKVLTPNSQMEGEKVLTPSPSPKTERGVVPVRLNTTEDKSSGVAGINEKTSEDETSSTGGEDNWGEEFSSLSDIHDIIGRDFTKQEANRIINSIKICDPAVGSGHFLVSALNEIIAIKSELRILIDREGKSLHHYHVEVVNDELAITDEDGAPFRYNPRNRESQRVQEALFHEKQIIIENCLFGVDINPNSVKICRLRLWIELLKNAYYVQDDTLKHASPVCYADSYELASGYEPPLVGQLQTLPNIDINIKCGNSLISRFDLNADMSQALKKSKWTMDMYRSAVQTYREASSKEQKREMERLIDSIKKDFVTEIGKNDKRFLRLNKVKGELFNLTNQQQLFAMGDKEKTIWQKQVDKLATEMAKLETEIEEIRSNKIYENAFEWRFEFPEVLDNEGRFVGFDVVIGNPPYIRQEEFSASKPYLQSQYETYSGTADLYVYFVEKGLRIARQGGHFVYILPNKWMRAGYGLSLRKWVKNYTINAIIDFGDLPVFEEATTYPCIWFIRKSSPQAIVFYAAQVSTLKFENGLEQYLSDKLTPIDQLLLPDTGWTLVEDTVQKLIEKIKKAGSPLGEYVQGKIFRGVLTGLNEAFVIDNATRESLIKEDPKSAEIIKPFLAGRDIKRYRQPESNKYLIFTRRGIDINRHPAILGYLSQYKDRLEPKPITYLGNDWKGRKPGSYKWYEIQDAVDYYEEFEKPKILYQVFQVTPCFIFDENGLYCNNSIWILPISDKVLFAILNSRIGWKLISNYCTAIQNGYQLIWRYLEQIPIAKANEVQQDKITLKVDHILTLKKQDPNADTTTLEVEIDLMVYKLYGLTWEEVKIVDTEFALEKDDYEKYKF